MSENKKTPLKYWLAIALLLLVTCLWIFWGSAEMFYEGWGSQWYLCLAYLIPGILCFILTLVAANWPRAGGWLLLLLGSAFTILWWGLAANRHMLTWKRLAGEFPVSASLALIGIFLLSIRHRPSLTIKRYIWIAGAPFLTFALVAGYYLPIVLTRVDDGRRGARLILGNGVALVWAPAGPGWNWQTVENGYLSWDELARYGQPPIGIKRTPYSNHASQADMETTGLCRYLTADGLRLAETPQNIWRMPTTDEIVRSLVRHGHSAGCLWQNIRKQATCSVTPDKETPLWDPDAPTIYLWTAEEYNEEQAYFVSYNGRVSFQPKDWGNSRHGYRCVREP